MASAGAERQGDNTTTSDGLDVGNRLRDRGDLSVHAYWVWPLCQYCPLRYAASGLDDEPPPALSVQKGERPRRLSHTAYILH